MVTLAHPSNAYTSATDARGRCYCPTCVERCEIAAEPNYGPPMCGDDDVCDICGTAIEDVYQTHRTAYAAQQAEFARHAVNPTHEDGTPLPSGMRGT